MRGEPAPTGALRRAERAPEGAGVIGSQALSPGVRFAPTSCRRKLGPRRGPERSGPRSDRGVSRYAVAVSTLWKTYIQTVLRARPHFPKRHRFSPDRFSIVAESAILIVRGVRRPRSTGLSEKEVHVRLNDAVTSLLAWFAGVTVVIAAAPDLFAGNQGTCNGAVQCVSPYNCPPYTCCVSYLWKGCLVQSLPCTSCNERDNVCNGEGSHTCLCGNTAQSPCRTCYKPSLGGAPSVITCIVENCPNPSACETEWILPAPPNYYFTCACQ